MAAQPPEIQNLKSFVHFFGLSGQVEASVEVKNDETLKLSKAHLRPPLHSWKGSLS